MQQYQKAIEEFEKVIKVDKNHIDAYFKNGIYY